MHLHRLAHFIGLGVGAGANVLARYAVSCVVNASSHGNTPKGVLVFK